MIGLGKSIAYTSNSMKYGWNQEKGAEVVYKEYLAGVNPKEISQEFKIIQQQNHLCRKNTLSFVLSPTIEDGRELTKNDLHKIVEGFIMEMKLQERQAIGFVHRNKEHTHVHLYVNRIDFNGIAYKDSFIGKRSQQAAERVARELGLSTVREVQQERLNQLQMVREHIRQIHVKVMEKERVRDFDRYIKAMEQKGVRVIPSINRQNQLQGFRFKYEGHSIKGSDVHRSMSMGRIARQMEWKKDISQEISKEKNIKLLGQSVGISPNLAATIAKKAINIAIKKSIGLGMEI